MGIGHAVGKFLLHSIALIERYGRSLIVVFLISISSIHSATFLDLPRHALPRSTGHDGRNFAANSASL